MQLKSDETKNKKQKIKYTQKELFTIKQMLLSKHNSNHFNFFFLLFSLRNQQTYKQKKRKQCKKYEKIHTFYLNRLF